MIAIANGKVMIQKYKYTKAQIKEAVSVFFDDFYNMDEDCYKLYDTGLTDTKYIDILLNANLLRSFFLKKERYVALTSLGNKLHKELTFEEGVLISFNWRELEKYLTNFFKNYQILSLAF